MKFIVRHSIPGRMRLGYNLHEIKPRQAALAQSLVSVQDGVESVNLNITVGSFLVNYDPSKVSEKTIKALFTALDSKYLDNQEMLESVTEPVKQVGLLEELGQMTFSFFVNKLLPSPIRFLLRIKNLSPRIFLGLKTLLSGNISDTRVLDAAAIGISLYNGNISTADNINFLLNIGETVEDYTRRKSYQDLAKAIFSDKDPVQLYVSENEEKTIPLALLKKDDVAIVRNGAMIPCDGEIIKGEALVNQASITGEPLAVEKRVGSTVFAGTVVEEGEIFIKTRTIAKDSKVNSILKQIENNENLKVSSEVRSEHLADRLVKYNFLLTGIVALVTRDITKIISTLMVDYSCAMKLVSPIAVLSAMKEAAEHGIAVKGGKYLEDCAKADVLVMDKTGTLTNAEPHLSRIISFSQYSEDDLLKYCACLEEHYAHPIARAIVKAAEERAISHPEDHAKVEYIVAHGISSYIGKKRVLVGSSHFIFGDEKIEAPEDLEALQKEAAERGESLLYLALSGKLVGVFAINDPIRKEAKSIIKTLRRSGMKKIIMITGDEEGSARMIANQADVDSYLSRALPEDKLRLVKKYKEAGYKVVMLGDGINDAPALSSADVGIAMGESAAIAEDTADIVLSNDGLESLVKIRKLGKNLIYRIDRENKEIVLFNSLLIVLGLMGIIPPQSSALLHNISTIYFSAEATKPYLR